MAQKVAHDLALERQVIEISSEYILGDLYILHLYVNDTNEQVRGSTDL